MISAACWEEDHQLRPPLLRHALYQGVASKHSVEFLGPDLDVRGAGRYVGWAGCRLGCPMRTPAFCAVHVKGQEYLAGLPHAHAIAEYDQTIRLSFQSLDLLNLFCAVSTPSACACSF